MLVNKGLICVSWNHWLPFWVPVSLSRAWLTSLGSVSMCRVSFYRWYWVYPLVQTKKQNSNKKVLNGVKPLEKFHFFFWRLTCHLSYHHQPSTGRLNCDYNSRASCELHLTIGLLHSISNKQKTKHMYLLQSNTKKGIKCQGVLS